MTQQTIDVISRERELGAIIDAYNQVTERLKQSHDKLHAEVRRLTEELANKNRELARRERLAALGEMAAGLAHEIRNPLGGIELYANLLEKDLADKTDLCELARKIRSGVRILETLVGDVLAFAGDADLHTEPIHLDQVICHAVEMARARADRKNVVIETSPNLAGIKVAADRSQLTRALLNLLLNAIEAAGSDGWVAVRAEPTPDEPDTVSIHVADNGPGVTPELLDRIFNPFFTTKDVGTGLGLAIVHRICEAHGGRARAQNRQEGGAIFTLTLPAQPLAAGTTNHKQESW